jgi:hypothetical protein
MTANAADRAVKDYLKRLAGASRGLPRADRRELRSQIEEHLRVALSPDPSEAEVRTLLDRLGDPDEIVAEQYGPPAGRRGMGAQAVTAIVFLLLGGFLIGVGWLVGIVLLWTSRAWTTGEKVIGTLVVPGGLASAVYLGLLAGSGETCFGGALHGPGGATSHLVTHCTGATTTLDHVLAAILFAFLVLAPIGTAVFLARRARPTTA